MPSSYTISLRLTLQATGENNNTWGVILNNGVFGLVDYAVAGRLAFALSGTKTLTTALGATDEARAAFLDVTGGSGGDVILPAVSKGYFIRNAAGGPVTFDAGGDTATFQGADTGPIFSDGANVYPILIGGLPIRDFVIAAIAGATVNLPTPIGQNGKVLIVREVGLPPVETWVTDFIQASDVQGLDAAIAAATAALEDDLMGRILLF